VWVFPPLIILSALSTSFLPPNNMKWC
jgi:hypothetical protein